MPLLKRRFSELSTARIGTVTVVATTLLVYVSLNLGTVSNFLTQTHLTAAVAESGNLVVGDDVRLSGVKIGQVNSVELDGEHVRVEFSIRDSGTLGTMTRASVQTATVLGRRYLALLPAGTGRLRDGDVIPLERTDSPYDLVEILSQLNTTSENLNKEKLSQALETVSREFADSPAPLRSALQGVSRLSATIGSRDATLRELLTHANVFANTLAQRSGDIIAIVSDGNRLLTELDSRKHAIEQLVVNVTDLLQVVRGIAADNDRELGPALNQLNTVLGMLNKDSAEIAATIHGMNLYTGSLGEIANSAPLFMASVQNIAPPTNLVPGLPLGAYDSQKHGPSGPSLAPGSVQLPLMGEAPALPKGPTR